MVIMMMYTISVNYPREGDVWDDEERMSVTK